VWTNTRYLYNFFYFLDEDNCRVVGYLLIIVVFFWRILVLFYFVFNFLINMHRVYGMIKQEMTMMMFWFLDIVFLFCIYLLYVNKRNK